VNVGPDMKLFMNNIKTALRINYFLLFGMVPKGAWIDLCDNNGNRVTWEWLKNPLRICPTKANTYVAKLISSDYTVLAQSKPVVWGGPAKPQKMYEELVEKASIFNLFVNSNNIDDARLHILQRKSTDYFRYSDEFNFCLLKHSPDCLMLVCSSKKDNFFVSENKFNIKYLQTELEEIPVNIDSTQSIIRFGFDKKNDVQKFSSVDVFLDYLCDGFHSDYLSSKKKF